MPAGKKSWCGFLLLEWPCQRPDLERPVPKALPSRGTENPWQPPANRYSPAKQHYEEQSIRPAPGWGIALNRIADSSIHPSLLLRAQGTTETANRIRAHDFAKKHGSISGW